MWCGTDNNCTGACSDATDWTFDKDACFRAATCSALSPTSTRVEPLELEPKGPQSEDPKNIFKPEVKDDERTAAKKARLAELEELKKAAIAKEQFDEAHHFKQEIESLQHEIEALQAFQEAKQPTLDLNDMHPTLDAPGQEGMDGEGKPAEYDDEGTNPCCILHGPRMDEETILKQGLWCCYCCCGGVGWLTETHSPCHCLCKSVCCQQTCEMTEHESREGICGSVQTCCYCTPIFQIPAPEGVPFCMCCSSIIGSIKRTEKSHKKEVTVEDDPLTLFEHVTYEQHQPCFCHWCGMGCQPFFQTVYDGYFKCLCCRYSAAVQPPCESEGLNLCRLVVNAGLCVAQCRYPFKFQGNPICACGGYRCKKHIHIAGHF